MMMATFARPSRPLMTFTSANRSRSPKWSPGRGVGVPRVVVTPDRWEPCLHTVPSEPGRGGEPPRIDEAAVLPADDCSTSSPRGSGTAAPPRAQWRWRADCRVAMSELRSLLLRHPAMPSRTSSPRPPTGPAARRRSEGILQALYASGSPASTSSTCTTLLTYTFGNVSQEEVASRERVDAATAGSGSRAPDATSTAATLTKVPR
jgi:hypothetical protein